MKPPIKEIESRNTTSRRFKNGEFYFLEPDPNQKRTLSIVSGGIENHPVNHFITRSDFKSYGIEYVVSGECQFTIHDEVHKLSANSCFYYAPNTRYTIENMSSAPLIRYFINFTGDEAIELFERAISEKSCVLPPAKTRWIKRVFLEIHECGSVNSHLAQEICCHLIRYLFTRISQPSAIKSETQTRSQTLFEHCKTYLEDNYKTISSVHDVAKACYVSHPHLCRIFKRYSEETPSQMLFRLKLLCSVTLLENKRLLIKEIAEEVGFDDQYHFSRRFKNYFGVSPSHYLGSSKLCLTA